MPSSSTISCCTRFLLITALCVPLSAHAANITWTGASNNAWENASNWDNAIGPEEGDRAFLNAGSYAIYTASSFGGASPNYRGIIQRGGILDITGGEIRATELASASSEFDGTVNQSGGIATINVAHIGDAVGSNGQYFLTEGELKISRERNGFSLFLGTQGSAGNSGTGSFTISGGTFTTRQGVKLGDVSAIGTGNFIVAGSLSTEIIIGGANTDLDSTWEQHAGSTLSVEIDPGGCTPIELQDNSGTTGTSATFENGALLDVGYSGSVGGSGGTWVVMEVENGDIIDNGLAFAPGVDTGVWSFAIDNTGSNGLLTVTSSDSTNRDVFWDGSDDTLWENPLNWTNNFGPFTGAYVHIASGSVDYSTNSEAGIQLRGFRMTGGILNISSGDLAAAQLASAYSNLDGTTNQTGGDFVVNALEIGRTVGSDAHYNLSAGELTIARGKSGHSLYLGSNSSSSNSGDGTLTISGGTFTTRSGVKLGDATDSGNGTFAVLGSVATEIGIASDNNDADGFWHQHSGSTLKIGIDTGGATTIFLEDSATNNNGTYATFENGSLLDVDYHNIASGGGTWTIMEVENGDITDNGLAFAPGVDTNIWSFSIDNSGANGRLLVTAVGNPLGHALTIGSTLQQKMRYGMDYERLWYWTGGLNGSERDLVARWSAVDAGIDFVRVAVNSDYELTEGTYKLSAYTNKIIPLMQEMQQAYPDIKFFASPRPLNEAVSGAAWQPYPRWVTNDPGNGNFDFDPDNCAEYLVRYLLLMKSYGFKISFIDLTNEWQSNGGGGRLTQDDMDNIHEYLNVTYFNAPWNYSGVDSSLFLVPDDIPEIVAPSSWNYSQGTSWINNLDSGDKAAISIAASHNTDRSGDALTFANAVRSELGADTEIWNTEVHGWKSTSSENETTSFYYYLEAIRAGFGGINGWLAIGTTNQGHAYILNPSGTPTRNVKYHIYQKLSSTSNYGHALDIIQEPSALTIPLDSNDDNIPRTVAAFIKGNLMTVWVVNESASTVPLVITPSGQTIGESTVRRTRWTDPADVAGFVSYEPVVNSTYFGSSIPAESVCCFEIVLSTEDYSNDRIEAEDFAHSWGIGTETSGDVDGNQNLSNMRDGGFTRYEAIGLTDNSMMSFRVARPSGRPNGLIQIREGSSDGPLLGQVAVPVTGNWQSYQTIQTTLNVDEGIYNLYLGFEEDGTSTGSAMYNLNWFTVNESATVPVTGLTATATGAAQINLNWSAATGATGYQLRRSESPSGPFTTLSSNWTGTSYTDGGLNPATTYYYLITGNFPSGAGPASPAASATTFGEPIVPANLTLSTIGLGSAAGSGAAQVTLRIDQTGLGQSYQVYASATLAGGSWTPIGGVHAGTGGVLDMDILFDYGDPLAPRQFFRVEVSVD